VRLISIKALDKLKATPRGVELVGYMAEMPP
jgi:hypothetical protein